MKEMPILMADVDGLPLVVSSVMAALGCWDLTVVEEMVIGSVLVVDNSLIKTP